MRDRERRSEPRQAGWHSYDEFGAPREAAIAESVWDRAERTIDTGLLDASGEPIKRRLKGMDPIGFIRLS
jgi:hypothetical protein